MHRVISNKHVPKMQFRKTWTNVVFDLGASVRTALAHWALHTPSGWNTKKINHPENKNKTIVNRITV